jgi:aspartyl protease family protein
MKHFTIILILLICLTSCRGCSSIRHRVKNEPTGHFNIVNTRTNIRDRRSERTISNSVIKMRKENGVYYVPIEINGVNMEFIFDTGASIISISETEAQFLWKQGKLKENDFRGVLDFTDANGDISEGTIVNLRNVKIGDKLVYNVEASIVHNQIAPLLFGQSAMNHFGKITIDYNNNEITFN